MRSLSLVLAFAAAALGHSQILGLMAEGRSNQGIADRLGLEPRTVEGHVGQIFAKLGLEPSGEDHRRVLAVLAALRDPEACLPASWTGR